MRDLSTNYLGIRLKNPLIVGASYLTADIDSLKKIEDAGAAAVVYKSLFEEQIQLERAQMEDDFSEYTERHAEMITLFPHIEHSGSQEYLYNLKKARESVSIPMFASINAIFKESWVEYAQLLEQTGINGIELNFYALPKDADISGQAIEKQQIEILKEIKKVVAIPVSVKLSAWYTNPVQHIVELDKAGADGVVLFNRFYQPDIDIYSINHSVSHSLSNESENRLSMRFAGLLYGQIAANICSNSGIHSSADVIKMILAGADCVQVVSTLYQNKISYIEIILKELEEWMDRKKFASITEFRGKLSNKNTNDPFVYQRAQYIDLILKSGEIFKKYPVR